MGWTFRSTANQEELLSAHAAWRSPELGGNPLSFPVYKVDPHVLGKAWRLPGAKLPPSTGPKQGKRLGAGPESLRQAGIPMPPFPSFSTAHIKAKPLTLPPTQTWLARAAAAKKKARPDGSYLLSSTPRLWYSDRGGRQSQRGHCSLRPGLPQSGRRWLPTARTQAGSRPGTGLHALHVWPHLILTTTLPKWLDCLHWWTSKPKYREMKWLI